MTKLIRKNIRMSPEIAQYFEEKAESMGISQSALMVVALNDYMRQDRALKIMNQLESPFDFLKGNLPQRNEEG